jgi:DHA1 family multidrug resistance protein-like MFS transporter
VKSPGTRLYLCHYSIIPVFFVPQCLILHFDGALWEQKTILMKSVSHAIMGVYIMEKADNHTSFAPANKIFWTLSLAIFTTMLGVGIIVPLLPIYAQQLGATGVWIGLIFSGFSLSRSLCSPFAGRFSDLWGRKPLIAVGLFIYWLVSLGYLLAGDVAGLVAVRLIQGASAALIIPLALAYIGDIAPQDEEGRYIGSFTVSLFAGFGCGPLIGGLVMHRFGIETNFYLMSGLCLVAFLFVAFLLPHQRPVDRNSPSVPPSYGALLRSPISWGLFLFRFSNAFARGGLIAFLPLIAHKLAAMTAAQIGLVISGNILLVSVLQAPFGRLADRLPRPLLVLIGSGSFALLMALIPSCREFRSVLAVSLLMGIAGGMALPSASAIAVEEGRKFGMGSSMGFFNLGMSLGLGTGPILIGLIVDIFGLPAAFYVAAAIGLSGTLAFSGLSGRLGAGHFPRGD